MSEHRQPPPVFSFKRSLPLLVLGAGLVGFFVFGLDDYFSVAALQEHRATLVAFAARYGLLANLTYLVLYAIVVAFSLPGGALLTMIGGFLFGTVMGASAAVIGATLGATALFLIAKTSIGDALEARAGPVLKKMEAGFQADAFNYLLILRLVPLFPFFLVNLAPAFLGVRLKTYFMTTLFGIIPGTFVYASVGNGLGAILDAGGTPEFGRIFEPDILIPIIGLAVLALIPVIYKRLKGSGVKAVGTSSSSD
ncbi:MAG: TVP38/TMEM64 family protein [Sphingomonadales bacterium]